MQVLAKLDFFLNSKVTSNLKPKKAECQIINIQLLINIATISIRSNRDDGDDKA